MQIGAVSIFFFAPGIVWIYVGFGWRFSRTYFVIMVSNLLFVYLKLLVDVFWGTLRIKNLLIFLVKVQHNFLKKFFDQHNFSIFTTINNQTPLINHLSRLFIIFSQNFSSLDLSHNCFIHARIPCVLIIKEIPLKLSMKS